MDLGKLLHGRNLLAFPALFLLFKAADVFLNGSNWLWELVVFFPEGIVLVFALALSALCIKQKDKQGFAASVLLLFLAAAFLPANWSAQSQGGLEWQTGTQIKLVAFNTLWWEKQENGMLEYLEPLDADVYLLQEAKNAEEDAQYIKRVFPNHDVAFGSDFVTISKHAIIESSEGRTRGYLKTTLAIGGNNVSVFNVHLNNPVFSHQGGELVRGAFEVKKRQFAELEESTGKSACEIIAGDFNTKPNSKLLDYLKNTFFEADKTRAGLHTSWISKIPLFLIDYAFYSKSISAISYETRQTPFSDHDLIEVKLVLPQAC
ncbi:hypothetical protein HY993_02490 [Candidatus Micrarchaeota archaeon]|nr:hypothetical protein [Candidatus Micrarchaeota archaeon]